MCQTWDHNQREQSSVWVKRSDEPISRSLPGSCQMTSLVQSTVSSPSPLAFASKTSNTTEHPVSASRAACLPHSQFVSRTFQKSQTVNSWSIWRLPRLVLDLLASLTIPGSTFLSLVSKPNRICSVHSLADLVCLPPTIGFS